MTQLRDPFEHTEQKNGFTYISWSQAADRLDEAEPGWSFSIMAMGSDWVHGRLTFSDGRWFENIGYAENVEAQWKKEPLKDAVSDALKRCAALAGVARYLYASPTTHGGVGSSPAAAPVGQAAAGRGAPRPAASTVPPEPEWMGETSAVEQARSARPPEADDGGACPRHNKPWRENAKGFYCGTPIRKSPDGTQVLEWCDEKPKQRWLTNRGLVAAR